MLHQETSTIKRRPKAKSLDEAKIYAMLKILELLIEVPCLSNALGCEIGGVQHATDTCWLMIPRDNSN